MKPFAACVHYADPSFHGKLPALKTEDCKWQYSDITDITDTTVIMGTTATTVITANMATTVITAIMATTVTMAITGTTPKARQGPPFSAAPLA